VRGFTQDDAHIFCREDQIVEETEAFIRLTKMIHADLGMQTAYINLATRPEIRAGSDEFWDKAEGMLAEAAKAAGVFWKNEREFLRQAGPGPWSTCSRCTRRCWPPIWPARPPGRPTSCWPSGSR